MNRADFKEASLVLTAIQQGGLFDKTMMKKDFKNKNCKVFPVNNKKINKN